MGGLFGSGKQSSTDGGMAAMMAMQQSQAQQQQAQMQQQAADEKTRVAQAAADAAKTKADEDAKRTTELATAQNEAAAQQNALRQTQGLGQQFDNTRSKQMQALIKQQQGISGFGNLMGDAEDAQKQGFMGQGNTLVNPTQGRGFNMQNTGGRKYTA